MNKTFIVTGANNGIGFETAKGIAAVNNMVVMICRDEKKGLEAKEKIIKSTDNKNIHLYLCDLASQKSIINLSEKIHSDFNTIYGLINNAAIFMNERVLTPEGFETQFAVNHLAPFLLTNLLLDLILNSPEARIINVASQVHKNTTLNFEDLNSAKSYNPIDVYAKTKLMNVLFTYHLARLLSGKNISVNCLHPGVVATNLLSDYHKRPRSLKIVSSVFNLSPKQGAATTLYLALSDEVKNITGKYFNNSKVEESSFDSYNPVLAEKLWDISSELTNINNIKNNFKAL